MKKTMRKAMAALLSFSMALTAVPFVVSADGNEPPDYEALQENLEKMKENGFGTPATDSEICYKANSIEEVVAEHSGENYIALSGDIKDLHLQRYGENIYNMDDTGKLHIISYFWEGSEIKIKKGTELPWDKLGHTYIQKTDDETYLLERGNERNNVEKALATLRNCENVLAISNNFILYEDTKNSATIEGFYYKGTKSSDDIISANPDLKLNYVDLSDKDSKNYPLCDKYDSFFYIRSDNYKMTDIYGLFSEMKKNGDDFSCNISSTELVVLDKEADVYSYCQDAVIINGIEGDANIDGDTDISDSVMIMQSIANPDKYGLKAPEGITRQGCVNADTNGDGVTNADALAIQKKLLKLD